MDGFRRMLWVGRQHSADHIPVSALLLVIRRSVGWAELAKPIIRDSNSLRGCRTHRD